MHQLARLVNNGLQHTLCFDLVNTESEETSRDPGMNPFGEPYTSKSFCGLLYISDIEAMSVWQVSEMEISLSNTPLAATGPWETEICQFPSGHGTSLDPK